MAGVQTGDMTTVSPMSRRSGGSWYVRDLPPEIAQYYGSETDANATRYVIAETVLAGRSETKGGGGGA